MKVVAVLIIIATAAISVALLFPVKLLMQERQALAQRAIEAGFPAVAATLLAPLAEMNDVQSLNNLGVLRARGVGIERDREAARTLFDRAAHGGSVRARLNVIRTTGHAAAI
jgi:TPR repeat protein